MLGKISQTSAGRRRIRLPALLSDALGPFKYYGPHFIFCPLALWSFVHQDWTVFAIPVLIFVLSPIVEHFIEPDLRSLDPIEYKSSTARTLYDAAVYLAPVTHFTLIFAYLSTVLEAPTWWVTLGMVLTMGTFCGALGINVAHELLHRRTWWERALSRLLVCSTLYGHFYTEHIRGHHARVATPEDPVTARRGEPLYRFWLRSSVMGYASAWRIDPLEVAISHLLQGSLWLFMGWVWGLKALLWLLPCALVGVLLLETINYIEHYGLSRELRPSGRYAPTRAQHSWTSNHVLSRWFMFELTRHADHHAHINRAFPLLQDQADSPQLPSGYPAMMALALIPPLWYRVMHPRLPQVD